ncbi:MAG TPA: hypothetical protein VGM13_13560 [Thermoanaerobaculia bacterium]|jgi:hypothetical protein
MSTKLFRAALAAALFAAPAAVAGTAAAPRPILPFIEDDYTKALASAKASGKPIFFEAWAPW